MLLAAVGVDVDVGVGAGVDVAGDADVGVAVDLDNRETSHATETSLVSVEDIGDWQGKNRYTLVRLDKGNIRFDLRPKLIQKDRNNDTDKVPIRR